MEAMHEIQRCIRATQAPLSFASGPSSRDMQDTVLVTTTTEFRVACVGLLGHEVAISLLND